MCLYQGANLCSGCTHVTSFIVWLELCWASQYMQVTHTRWHVWLCFEYGQNLNTHNLSSMSEKCCKVQDLGFLVNYWLQSFSSLALPLYCILQEVAEDLQSIDSCEYIWESGVGFANSPPQYTHLDQHRAEILKLLLTCFSETMYLPPLSKYVV